MDKLFVSVLSVVAIIVTYWFFLMRKDPVAVVAQSDTIDIAVQGGYKPSVISVSAGKQITLNFLRTDPSSCLEEVVIPDFKVRKYLPLNMATPVRITPTHAGKFEISCGMNMFHGKIIVT
jgi:plastocyanin domain-containing protein